MDELYEGPSYENKKEAPKKKQKKKAPLKGGETLYLKRGKSLMSWISSDPPTIVDPIRFLLFPKKILGRIVKI